MAAVISDKSIILILCKPIQCDPWIDDGLIFFFYYLLFLERNPPSHVRFCLTICLNWELLFLFSLWFKFSSAWFYFLSKCMKERGIKLSYNLSPCPLNPLLINHIFSKSLGKVKLKRTGVHISCFFSRSKIFNNKI